MGKKIWKYNKSTVIIFLVCVILSVPCLAVIRHFRVRPAEGLLTKAEDYYSVIADEADKPGKFVFLKIADAPYLFAEETTEYTDNTKDHAEYYFVFDEEGRLYVVQLAKSAYNDICKAYENDPDDFAYTVTGVLEQQDEDLVDLIIEILNEEYYAEFTRSNYGDYFSATYLNASTLNPNKATVAVASLILIALQLTAIYQLIIIVKGFINIKSSFKATDKAVLEDEFSQAGVVEYPKAKLFMLSRHFVSMNVGMIASRYSDIAWVYISSRTKTKLGITSRFSGFKSSLEVYLKSGKSFTTAPVKRTEPDFYNELIDELVRRNPDIMVGYSYENLSSYKKITNK